MCAHRGKIEIEAEPRQWGSVRRLIKGVIVRVLRLIAAHLHPEPAPLRTPTSSAPRGLNSTIKTPAPHKN